MHKYYAFTNNIQKIISLCFINVLIYVIVGSCLTSQGLNINYSCIGIILYHYYVADFVNQKLYCIKEHFWQQNLFLIFISGFMTAIIYLLVASAQINLEIYQSTAIALMATINSYVMLILMVRYWGCLRATVCSVAFAWLGLFLGWTVGQYHIFS